MTVHRYIQCPKTFDLIPYDEYYKRQEVDAPVVWGDVPAYESPVTGEIIEGRKARREDLRRTGSREWEGIEQERKEAARRTEYINKQQEQQAFKAAEQAFRQLPENVRRQLARY